MYFNTILCYFYSDDDVSKLIDSYWSLFSKIKTGVCYEHMKMLTSPVSSRYIFLVQVCLDSGIWSSGLGSHSQSFMKRYWTRLTFGWGSSSPPHHHHHNLCRNASMLPPSVFLQKKQPTLCQEIQYIDCQVQNTKKVYSMSENNV